MPYIEKILRYSLAIALIVTAGDIFFRFIEWSEPPVDALNFLISLTAAEFVWPSFGAMFLISGGLLFSDRLKGLALVLLFPAVFFVLIYSFVLDSSFPAVIFCFLYAGLIFLNFRSFRSLVGR